MKMPEKTTGSEAEVLGIYGKLVGLKEMKRGSKDRLKLLIRLTFDTMNFPPIRIILMYVFCQYCFATFLALFHLLRKFDTKTLLRHGSFCGFQIFVLINLWVILFLSDDIYKFLRTYEKSCLPVEMLNKNNLKRVVIMSNMLKVISCLNMIFATMAALGFITAPEYFNEKTYLAVWIQETFPEYSKFMLMVVQLTSLPVALVMAGTSVSWAYVGVNTLFQMYILKEMLQGISKSNIPQKMRLDSQIYQTEVREKLVTSIMAFELEFECQGLAGEVLEAPLWLFSIGSIILGGSLMIEFLSNQEQNLGDQYAIYVGIFFFSLAGTISANLYILIGQAVKEESEECNYLLCQLPWYDMNKENRMIYSIFLGRTEKSFMVSNTVLRLDYSLLVRIVKTLYSLAAVLAQFVSSNGLSDSS